MPAFEWPWVFLLLPAPYLAFLFLPAYEPHGQALRVPFFARFGELLDAREVHRARSRSRFRLSALLIVWCATLFALSRPYRQGAPIERETSARDLLLAVDLSGSMAQADLSGPEPAAKAQVRLEVVKRVVGEFVERRRGDRIGLIVFGTGAFVQTPFTHDTRVVNELLQQTEVGMAGPKTALGDAVGLALNVLQRSSAKSRVVIVLTDGNDTGSNVPPVQAARISAARGVTLHIIGVGDPRAAGEEALNTAVLTRMATLTGGRFFRANDTASMEEAYRTLDALEPIAHRTTVYQPKKATLYEPLAVVIALLGVAALAGAFVNLRRAWSSRRSARVLHPAQDPTLGSAANG